MISDAKNVPPMTETMVYILLALAEPRHGYGIMLHVRTLTGGRLSLGAGTIYNSLTRMTRDGLISVVRQTRRRKTYALTAQGRALLGREIERIGELWKNAQTLLNQGFFVSDE